jgi:hypothetical protein
MPRDGPKEHNDKGNKWMKFDMGFKDINNWVATLGMINSDKVIRDIMMMVWWIVILVQG